MSTVKYLFNGWPVVGWSAALVLSVAVMCVQFRGPTAAGYGLLVGLTAMTSTVFFMGAYTAAAAHRLTPNAATAWQRRNRRQLGVSFAFSHTVHLGAIIALVRSTGQSIDPLTLVAGSLAYVFIFAMAATSFDRTAALLGTKRWRRLHTWGIHYLWFLLIFTYATTPPLNGRRIAFILLLAAGLGLRIVARRAQQLPAATT